MQEENYDFDIITVTDDDGVEHQFEEIDRIETDDGNRYVAMLPIFESGEELLEDDGEAIILKVLEENGETYLVEIDDEKEYNEVRDFFQERLDELFEYDESEEEE
ncbi:MAG: DUF1292 domain-containing protein [Acutalibacteraceae bacterium]|nr:DUF1292 domain-containing protein [Oscillospiraceae bacterium]